jgi:hypothetical protein
MSETMKTWWVITVANYGAFDFFGTEAEAEKVRRHKARWEQSVAHKRLKDADKLVWARAMKRKCDRCKQSDDLSAHEGQFICYPCWAEEKQKKDANARKRNDETASDNKRSRCHQI